MRDENGFKCHVQSESHVRQVLLIGEDPKKYIEDYSEQFLSNFINMLKTTHGEKKVHINQFYQQVIADKHHIHMNATRWKSLTQFAAHLGREGICRVEETEKGLFVSWIDNSPETLRKREAILKKERQDKGDEEREQRQIQEQVERAQRAAEKSKQAEAELDYKANILERREGQKLQLNIGLGSKANGETKPKSESPDAAKDSVASPSNASPAPTLASTVPSAQPGAKLSLSLGEKKPKNVFASAVKKNPLAGKKGSVMEPPKKMTEQERIMKAEMEAMQRKRTHGGSGFPGPKRPKVS